MNNNFKIASITRSHKGKGVTVTIENNGTTKDYVIRKSGGEKYSKIGLWQFTPDRWELLMKSCNLKHDSLPITISIHKEATKVEPRTPQQAASIGCQLIEVVSF
jgi:hypothetical protein